MIKQLKYNENQLKTAEKCEKSPNSPKSRAHGFPNRFIRSPVLINPIVEKRISMLSPIEKKLVWPYQALGGHLGFSKNGGFRGYAISDFFTLISFLDLKAAFETLNCSRNPKKCLFSQAYLCTGELCYGRRRLDCKYWRHCWNLSRHILSYIHHLYQVYRQDTEQHLHLFTPSNHWY